MLLGLVVGALLPHPDVLLVVPAAALLRDSQLRTSAEAGAMLEASRIRLEPRGVMEAAPHAGI